MKRTAIFALFAAAAFFATARKASAQDAGPREKPAFRNAYYDVRRAEHDSQSAEPGAVVFLGNSITEQGWWETLFPRQRVLNRGIGGDNAAGMLDRLEGILALRPSKIFLMAGINDLVAGREPEAVAADIEALATAVARRAPGCELCIQSVLPVNDGKLAYDNIRGQNPRIARLNALLREVCQRCGAIYVELTGVMADGDGALRREYTKDGIHLHPRAYVAWAEHIKRHKYLN